MCLLLVYQMVVRDIIYNITQQTMTGICKSTRWRLSENDLFRSLICYFEGHLNPLLSKGRTAKELPIMSPNITAVTQEIGLNILFDGASEVTKSVCQAQLTLISYSNTGDGNNNPERFASVVKDPRLVKEQCSYRHKYLRNVKCCRRKGRKF